MRKPYSRACERLIQRAYEIALQMNHEAVGSEHLLLAILEDTSLPMTQYLNSKHVNALKLYQDCECLQGKPKEEEHPIIHTQIISEVLSNAELMSKDQMQPHHLCRCLLMCEHSVALELLQRYQIDIDELLEVIDEIGLEEFEECQNLNLENRNPNITGRNQELMNMISVLCRKEKANILLIGDAGVGKSAIVEKLAEMIETRTCPELLWNHTIYELSLNAVVAGTKYRGEFEDKMQKILKAIEANSKSILFIDEMHQLLGAGRAEGSLDAAGILKPMLARGKIKCIGATTKDEYHKFIEKDRALERRFQIIRIQEPELEATRQMLSSKLVEYEQFHHVSIPESLLDNIIKLSNHTMPLRHFPDKAIDLLDQACVKAKLEKKKKLTEKHLRLACSEISQIPLEPNHDELVPVLNKYYSSCIIESLIEELGKDLENDQVRCWYVKSQQSKELEKAEEILGRYYFHQPVVHLDSLNLDTGLEYALESLALNPFSLLVIDHFHESSYAVQVKLKESIRQGVYIHQRNKVSLKHVLVWIKAMSKKNNSFLKNKESQSEKPDFCQLVFDFSFQDTGN